MNCRVSSLIYSFLWGQGKYFHSLIQMVNTFQYYMLATGYKVKKKVLYKYLYSNYYGPLGLPRWHQWLKKKKKKNLPAKAGDTRDMGLIPGSGRSPGGRHSNPLQYSCLENPWMGPGNLQSKGLQRAGHDWSDLACTHRWAFYLVNPHHILHMRDVDHKGCTWQSWDHNWQPFC